MNIGLADIIIIVIAIIGIIVIGLYFFSKWAYKKMGDQQNIIERMSQTTSIYVIDKKRCKISEANLPKIVSEKMPKYAKFMKMSFVKAKVGPQIITFLCDKKVYKVIPTKKNVKVDIAGIYITNMKGMKTKEEMKKLIKEKKKD